MCLICLAHPSLVLRADEKAPLLLRAGGGRRVNLWDGQRITGQILDVNEDTVQMRTAWAPRLKLPRAAVATLSPLPGWRTILDEDFHRRAGEPAALAAGLKLAGDPAFADAENGTAGRALVLGDIGQSLTCTLSEPLIAGRVGVNFQERDQPRGARWLVELLFQQGAHTRRVTVTIVGNGEHYSVDAGERGRVSAPRNTGERGRVSAPRNTGERGRVSAPRNTGERGRVSAPSKGTSRRVARSPGWHRLIVKFSQPALRLTADDDVLWYNLEDGPGGRLRQVTIRCQQTRQSEAIRGSVAWAELSIDRAVTEHPPPPVDAEQDAISLLDDDRIFGRIVRADRRTIQIEGRFGKRSLPWRAVSGCSFRRPPAPPKANEGAKVRLRVHSGMCPETDILEGVVIRQDERQLVLRHALLGEVTLERSRVRESRQLGGALHP